MNLVEQALTEHWGEKCADYEQGCPVCDAWREYENLVTYGASETPNHEELLKNLLIAIANDRDAMRIMATKKEMAEAVAAMKHLWL